MACLSLYIDPAGRSSLHRSGFSWVAALALPLFALHRRQWRTLVAASLAMPVLHGIANAAIEAVPGDTAQGLLALAWLLGWSAACGAFANAWHRRSLERAGYRLVATERRPAAPIAPMAAAP